MAQKTGPKGLALIKSFEGCVLYPYDDLVPSKGGKYPEWTGGPLKGTATIYIGHTNAAKHPLKVVPGYHGTEEEALEVLAVDLGDCEADVHRLVTMPLNQGQFDACVSFDFNAGPGNFKNIAARINRGAYDEARAAFDLYVKARDANGNTIVLKGLQRRRDAEQALWDQGDYEKEYAPDTTVLPVNPVDHPAEVEPEGPSLPAGGGAKAVARPAGTGQPGTADPVVGTPMAPGEAIAGAGAVIGVAGSSWLGLHWGYAAAIVVVAIACVVGYRWYRGRSNG